MLLSVSGSGSSPPGLQEVWGGTVLLSRGCLDCVLCRTEEGHFYRLLAESFLESVEFAAVCVFSAPVEGESLWQGLSVKVT